MVKNKSLQIVLSDDEIYSGMSPQYSKRSVLDNAKQEIEKYAQDNNHELDNDRLLKAMSLKEYENASLMTLGLSDLMRPFALQLSLSYQAEYKCETMGRKSLAEMAAMNYCRVLEIQRKMRSFLSKNEYGDLTVKIMLFFSKEIDRAQRHYLTSLQALEIGLQPPLNVSVRTQVANVANQQMVQNQIAKDKAEYGI